MAITIEQIPLSGVVRVFDLLTRSVVFSATEDMITKRIGLQQPVRIYSVDDVTYIDVNLQKVYYDSEAHWFYYESYFRSLYDDRSDSLGQTFEAFMEDTLEHEPIWEVT